jgi:hypothetical protein
MDLTKRMVKPAGTGPAVGTAKDCFIAMGLSNSVYLCSGDIECFIPGELDPFIAAATITSTITPIEPAAPK